MKATNEFIHSSASALANILDAIEENEFDFCDNGRIVDLLSECVKILEAELIKEGFEK